MENFKKFLFIKKGFSPITVGNYIGGINRLENKLGKEPSNSQMEEYIYQMYNSDYSYSHKTNTALAIERYSEFLNRPIKLGRQKKPKTIIKDTLTEAEITTMIFCCKNLKEKAMISLLAYSGIRNKELCNLKVNDFDGNKNQIRILGGKGKKDGVSQISVKCSKILQEYIFLGGLKEDDFIFNTYQGNQYTSWALRKRVKVVSSRTMINKRVYPHLFRSSLSVNMLIRGVDIISLKNQLRHSDIRTTFQYLNSIILEERNNYTRFEPSYI